MPFGSVPGLIGFITHELRAAGVGVCVISTFKTDFFFFKESKFENALNALKKSGWAVV